MFDPFGWKRIEELESRLALSKMDNEDLYARLEDKDAELAAKDAKIAAQTAEAFRVTSFLGNQLKSLDEAHEAIKKGIAQKEAMLRSSEEARKSLAAKLNEALSKLEQRDARFTQLLADFSETTKALEAAQAELEIGKAELDELYKTHEEFVKKVMEGQEVAI